MGGDGSRDVNKAFYKIFITSGHSLDTMVTLKNNIEDLELGSIVKKTANRPTDSSMVVDKVFEESVVKSENFYSDHEDDYDIFQNVFDKSLVVKFEELGSENYCKGNDFNQRQHLFEKKTAIDNTNNAIDIMQNISTQVPIVVLIKLSACDENINNLANVQNNFMKTFSKSAVTNTQFRVESNLNKPKRHGKKSKRKVKKNYCDISQSPNKIVCRVCLKEFKGQYKFKRHMLIHSKARNYSCKYCFKSFKRSSCVTRHLLTHKKDKRYLCDVCSKSFTVREYLIRHIQLHSAKRYKCDKCASEYKDRRTLLCHLIRHDINKKTFLCDLCGTKFLEKRFLRKHFLRKRHRKTSIKHNMRTRRMKNA